MKATKLFLTLGVAGLLSTGIYTSAEEVTGKDLFVNNKCNTCHAIKTQEIESKQAGKYPDLSNVGSKEFTAEFLHKYLMKEEKINNKQHPIKFKGEMAELETMVSWLLTLKDSETK